MSSGQGPMAGFYKQSDELSASIKLYLFFTQLTVLLTAHIT
jgi:hypothetical protein